MMERTVEVGDGAVDATLQSVNVLREYVLDVVELGLHGLQPQMGHGRAKLIYSKRQKTNLLKERDWMQE